MCQFTHLRLSRAPAAAQSYSAFASRCPDGLQPRRVYSRCCTDVVAQAIDGFRGKGPVDTAGQLNATPVVASCVDRAHSDHSAAYHCQLGMYNPPPPAPPGCIANFN